MAQYVSADARSCAARPRTPWRHVKAKLHNMLVYGPGQFFAIHQDSEKDDDMIGTLVVILPSAFTGGAMVIEHHGEQVAFRAGPALVELLDSDIELRHWTGPGERLEAIVGAVDRDEACYTMPSVELEPFASEHEGYMGNWGNTVDRWYGPAAVTFAQGDPATSVMYVENGHRAIVGLVARGKRSGGRRARCRISSGGLPCGPNAANGNCYGYGPEHYPGRRQARNGAAASHRPSRIVF